MTAGLPRSCHGANARTPFPSRPSCRMTHCACRGFPMMDDSVRGSYDINNAKCGIQRHGARGRS